jgi:PDZ domain-containing protein
LDPTVPEGSSADRPSADPAAEAQGAAPGPGPRRRRVVRVVVSLAVIGAVIAVAVIWAFKRADQYYIFEPGTAPLVTTDAACQLHGGELALPNGDPCVRIDLPASKTHPVEGKIFMVDVEVGQADPIQWLQDKLGILNKADQLVPLSNYAGTTPTSELGCQDTQQMVGANEDAALAALSKLSYPVNVDTLGAQVDEVGANTPAWNAGLSCNDLITSVNGKVVKTADDLTNVIHSSAPGTKVTLGDKTAAGPVKTVSVVLGTPPPNYAYPKAGFLGIEVETRIKPVLPFNVSVNAGDIGGPSAGLAFTLGILDSLSNGKLTGGHLIAATGTIDPAGNVGDVGGVAQKTVAVERAGAVAFFVPKQEYQAAESVAGGKLQVISVTSLQQVLSILQQRFGGDLSGLKSS